jgi:superfamily II DNA or RNA helicase
MKTHQFQTLNPDIADNQKLRRPQREGFKSIQDHFAGPNAEREVSIILPVGCGKSGLIALTPFAVKSMRTLVIAPGVDIADQLLKDFDPTGHQCFYVRCGVLDGNTYPEAARVKEANKADLDEADVVVTNIQQLQGQENKWLGQLPKDYFDLILFDEGHHNVAESWAFLRSAFPNAKVVNFSATPARADGQLMTGKIIYSFPVSEAISLGLVKSLKAVVLNPTTLKYIRNEDGQEIEVSLDEVIRLGEDDSDFRRSIVSSKESLETIVSCAITELRKLREATKESRLKIISSALNYRHCIQITKAYQERGMRAAYVHSKEEGQQNKKILQALHNHELDVIVQVRKLGEGFDHRHLSVAAVCSIFTNLSPFVQFVGRIMRALVPNEPGNPLNQGIVVFHAGANIRGRWTDFQQYSTADQEYFDQLLPLEELNFDEAADVVLEPTISAAYKNPVEIKKQSDVAVEEIHLLNDPQALAAIEYLTNAGYSAEQVTKAMLKPVPVSKQKMRIAGRKALDDLVGNEVARALYSRSKNPKGRDLDQQKPPRENFVVLKASVDLKIAAMFNREVGQRGQLTQEQLDVAEAKVSALVSEALQEILDG